MTSIGEIVFTALATMALAAIGGIIGWAIARAFDRTDAGDNDDWTW